MIAASANRVAICELLLTAGADPSLTDNYGQDAISIARDGDADGARRVVERGIIAAAGSSQRPSEQDPIVREDGLSETETVEPHRDAVIDSWISQLSGDKISKLEKKAPRKPPPHCFPITQSALRSRLASGEDIDVRDADGMTALMVSARLDKPKMCRLLMEAGANPELRDGLGQNVLAIAEAHGAEAALREIESALSRANISAEQNLSSITARQGAIEPVSLEESNDEGVFDFGGWEAEPDAATPQTDDDILARATEIQRAISTHEPKDDAQGWDDLDPLPQYRGLESGDEIAETIESSGVDVSGDEAWHTRRASTWEAIRQRNEEAAKRKRAGLAPERATSPLATPKLSKQVDLTVNAQAKTATPATASKPLSKPSIAERQAYPATVPGSTAKSTPLPQEKPTTLKMVLAEAKRAGFHVQVDGESIAVDIHAANDSKSRKIIRQLTDFGFEHRPLVGYCK